MYCYVGMDILQNKLCFIKLLKNTTSICQFLFVSYKISFGKQGWCSLKEKSCIHHWAQSLKFNIQNITVNWLLTKAEFKNSSG